MAMTTSDVFQAMVALGVGGLLGDIVRSFFQRKKVGADYADVISASAVRLIEPLEHQIDDLEEALGKCRTELKTTRIELRHSQEELGNTQTALDRALTEASLLRLQIQQIKEGMANGNTDDGGTD